MNKKIINFIRLSHCLTATLLVASLFSSLVTYAQKAPTTIRLEPDEQEPRFYGGQHTFYFLPPGQTGENYQSAGFFGQKLRPYLGNSPEAVKELDSYRRQKSLFLADRALLLGAVVVYGLQVPAHSDLQYFNGIQQGAIGVAAASILATLFINRNTNNYLRQAVDNYNASLSPKPHGTYWLRLRPTSIGVAATPQGSPLLALRWQL